ncbi:MAG TPA: cyclase family protein [Vicinamibacterales bacterium]|jgi:kynurenine formamidase|nr:cyclase family protein [Vicinamibacterales bacterium]HJN46044.1 cyclase family protein [Vicinamibacterales bacterium]
MTTFARLAYSIGLLAALASVMSFPSAAQEPDTSVPLVTAAQYEQWRTELSNWGRWGTDDELGAANLITPDKRAEAAGLVSEGFTVSLASNAQKYKSLDNPCPIAWSMVRASRASASDTVAYPCIHGPGTTHLDAFAHIFFDGKMWNGYDVDGVVTMEDGAMKNSIMTVKDGLVTRGVLYDIPRLKGVPYLEPGTRITVADLEAWEEQTGVRVGSGDAFLIRWGRWARQDALGPFDTGREAAGLDNMVIPWLRERDVAIAGWETPGYMPQPEGDISRLALHNFALTILGIQVLDRADFQALATAAAARNRWEFMVTIAPLPIPNGTGSPVNPIAMF